MWKWIYIAFALMSLIAFFIGIHDIDGADYTNRDLFNGLCAFMWILLANIEDIKDRLRF